MGEGKELSEIRALGEYPIIDWNRIEIDEERLILFWTFIYEPKEKCEGIRFYVADWVSKDVYPPGPDKYERMVEGYGFFDGIRHLYFGPDDDHAGYFNYPKLEVLIDVLEAIKKLEDEHLPNHEEF